MKPDLDQLRADLLPFQGAIIIDDPGFIENYDDRMKLWNELKISMRLNESRSRSTES